MAEDLERFDPAVQKGRLAYEHLHRYALCRGWVESKHVLDLACGSGYGTAILGQVAARATGVDLDRKSIVRATERYGGNSVSYVVGDCYNLPFEDNTFDVVVANEMIEHVEDHDRLISEVKRVLKRGGCFLVSTPNKPIYNRYKPPNVFHVSEMEIGEFKTLLTRHFTHVRLNGTRMMLSSVSFDLEQHKSGENQASAKVYTTTSGKDERYAIGVQNGALVLSDPEYVLAACSVEPLNDMFPTSSVFVSPSDDLWLQHEKVMAWASNLHEEDEELRAKLGAAEAAIAQRDTQVAAEQREREGVQRVLAEARQEIDALLTDCDRQVEQARMDARNDWSALARYVELLTDHEVGASPTELLKGLYRLNERLSQVREELPRLQDQLQRERVERETGQNARAQAAEDLASLRGQLAALTASREETVHNLAQMRQQIAEDYNARAALTVELNRIREASNLRLAEAQAKCDSNLAAIRAASEAQLTLLASENAAAKNDLRVERSRLRALQDTLKQITDDRDRLRLAQQHSEAAVRQSSEALRDSLRKAAQNEAQWVTAKQQLEGSKVLAQDALARVEASEEILRGVHVRLERSEETLEALRTRHAAVVSERHAVGVALEEAQAEIASMKDHFNAVRQNVLRALPGSRKLSPRERRHRDEFRNLHRAVRAEMAEASREVGRTVIPAPDRRARGAKNLLPLPRLRSHTCLFRPAWIARHHSDLGRVSWSGYLRNERLWSIDPHPLFDAAMYSEQRCEIDGRPVAPLRHYIEQGWREGRDPHPLFSNDWYLHRNPDVLANASMSPLEHYLLHGWREGRRPNPLFDPVAYLDRYPDVRSAGMEPLTHYVAHGLPEGRELPIRGLTPNARLWMPEADRNRPALDFVLRCNVPRDEPEIDVDAIFAEHLPPQSAATIPRPSEAASAWPPQSINDYWPPQGIRDFILDRYDEATLARISYLYSAMNAFEGEAETFSASPACRALVTHASDRANSVAATQPDEVEVSIIVPVYNNILDTLLCISSVLDADTLHSYEIIVADDCSTDATPDIIPLIGGCVRHVRHVENLGFLSNCNAAAAHAKGKYVLLLNNDTLVMPRWLDALIDPFERFERIGLTGAKLINWNGSLQEAGGIYWNDGSAWNFGRNQAPRAPQFSYVKDVDYVSGAAICVPRTVWGEMNGFDPLFAPAYCEDSDLAFRLRAAGYRTLLAPEAEVIHHEGRSHGRDIASGVKAYQVTNSQRLFERWKHVLQRDHFPNAVNVLRARDRSFEKRHVLVVDHYVPQWDQDAGSRSTYNCIEAFLALGYSVTLWPDNLWRDPDYTPAYQAMGVEVIYGAEFQNGFEAFIRERTDLYDAAFINRPHIAEPYIDALRQNTKTKIMFYGHDLHFRRLARAREIGENVTLDQIKAAREQELSVCGKSDVVFYPDQAEVDFVARTVGGSRQFLSLPVMVYPDSQITSSRRRLETIRRAGAAKLLFVGGFNHTPNRDGIIWFVNEVLPIVRRRFGAVDLSIVGSKPPKEVLALESAGISVEGFVSDAELERLYKGTTLAVAPLRFGAGVKGKVIEALANAVPLVTTSVGAQGLIEPQSMLFLGDGASEFAEVAVTALTDREEAFARAEAGLNHIARNYSFEAMENIFRKVVG